MKLSLLPNIVIIPAAALLFLSSPSLRAEPIPEVSVRLEPEEVVLGETATLTVSAAWTGEASDLAFTRPDPPTVRGLAVTGSHQRGITYREGSDLRRVREFIFTLRGEEEGPGRVGAVTLTYQRPDGSEHTVATEVIPVPVVSRGSARGNFPIPATVALALAAAILIAVYIRWMVRRYKKKSNELIADYVENLESQARRDLEGTRRHRLEGETGKYCDGLRTVLLHYREQKTAASQPPAGGGQAESPGIPPEDEAELDRIIDRLEELRFSGSQKRLEELDRLYRRATLLLERLENLTAGRTAEN